jgi:hypothetical protein
MFPMRQIRPRLRSVNAATSILIAMMSFMNELRYEHPFLHLAEAFSIREIYNFREYADCTTRFAVSSYCFEGTRGRKMAKKT